jgi:ABC-type polysaccharide/polyol phosphate export permease
MFAYLASIWKCRYFWLSLVHNDLRSRYRGSALGIGWSLLQPLGMTIILCIVFAGMWGLPLQFFAPFLMAGLALWNYIVVCTVAGSQSFFQGESYIRQFPAPMAIYPLRIVLGAGFHASLSLFVALLAACYFLRVPGILPLLSLLPSLVLLFLFGWFLAILFGLANVMFRDTQHLTEVGLQGLFYLTPIIYPLEQFAERARFVWILKLNPLVPLFDLIRQPIIYNAVPSAGTYHAAILCVLFTGLIAVTWLSRQERRIIFHL